VRRDQENETKKLQEQILKINTISNMKSSINLFALQALRTARDQGWLSDGSLREIDLTGANLRSADFAGAVLDKVNFQNTCLEYANFCNASLRCSNFTGACLKGTSWDQAAYDHLTVWPARFVPLNAKKVE